MRALKSHYFRKHDGVCCMNSNNEMQLATTLYTRMAALRVAPKSGQLCNSAGKPPGGVTQYEIKNSPALPSLVVTLFPYRFDVLFAGYHSICKN